LLGEYILGVDGGGTQTKCSIISLDGFFHASGKAGPSNPITIGVEEAHRNIMEAVKKASKKCGINKFKTSVLGIAGTDRSKLKDVLFDMLPENFGEKEIVSDAEAAVAGAIACKPGIIVIAGTGSIVYGKNWEGVTARAGGWGWRLGDEGSGYTIGKNAIISSLKAHDGRGPPTSLTSLITKKLGLEKLEEIIDWAYDHGRQPRDFASLVPIVRKAEKDGDEVASLVLGEAGSDLGLVTHAVIRRLDLDKEFPAAFSGGIFKDSGPYTIALEEVIRREAPECFFITPMFGADIGSCLLALEKLGIIIDDEILRRLNNSIGK